LGTKFGQARAFRQRLLPNPPVCFVNHGCPMISCFVPLFVAIYQSRVPLRKALSGFNLTGTKKLLFLEWSVPRGCGASVLIALFADRGLLMIVKCPCGHWYDPEAPGSTGRCPQCATQTQSETSISDDDVLAILNPPEGIGKSVSPESSEGEAANKKASAIMRRKKVCPDCSHEASYSFVYCPRCGAPLKVASVELH